MAQHIILFHGVRPAVSIIQEGVRWAHWYVIHVVSQVSFREIVPPLGGTLVELSHRQILPHYHRLKRAPL